MTYIQIFQRCNLTLSDFQFSEVEIFFCLKFACKHSHRSLADQKLVTSPYSAGIDFSRQNLDVRF